MQFKRKHRKFQQRCVCVESESYTTTDTLLPILQACCTTLLPACVFVTRDTLHHPRCVKRNLLEKYSFPQRSIDTWNGLKEEVIIAKNIQQLKEKLDKYRYEDRTT